jgi:hypothetical protein
VRTYSEQNRVASGVVRLPLGSRRGFLGVGAGQVADRLKLGDAILEHRSARSAAPFSIVSQGRLSTYFSSDRLDGTPSEKFEPAQNC